MRQGIGLNYFGVRYYDAEVGRWVSVEPKKQYFYPYINIDNNPITNIVKKVYKAQKEHRTFCETLYDNHLNMEFNI